MLVSPTTTKITTYPTPDLLQGWIRVGSEKPLHCHNLTRSAVATLKCIMLKEGLLNWPEILPS